MLQNESVIVVLSSKLIYKFNFITISYRELIKTSYNAINNVSIQQSSKRIMVGGGETVL